MADSLLNIFRGGRPEPWLALVALVGLALRASTIASSPLWLDELLQIQVASLDLSEIPAGVRAHAAAAPLDYLGTRLSMTLVQDPVIGPRLWPLLFGTLSIPAAFFAGRAWFDNRAGITAAVLMAGSPILVYYSTEARFYSLAVFLALVNVWALRSRRWMAYGISATAGIYTMYVFACLLAVGAAHLLRERQWAGVGALVVAGIAFVPWGVYALPTQMGITYEWDSPDLPIALGFALVSLTGIAAPIIVGGILSLIAMALSLIGMFRGRATWPLSTAAALIAIVMWVGVTRAHYFWAPRQVLLSLPLLLLLVAGGAGLTSERVRLISLAAYGILSGIPMAIVLAGGVGIK